MPFSRFVKSIKIPTIVNISVESLVCATNKMKILGYENLGEYLESFLRSDGASTDIFHLGEYEEGVLFEVQHHLNEVHNLMEGYEGEEAIQLKIKNHLLLAGSLITLLPKITAHRPYPVQMANSPGRFYQ